MTRLKAAQKEIKEKMKLKEHQEKSTEEQIENSVEEGTFNKMN